MPTAFRTAISPVAAAALPVSGAALWLDGADSSTLFTDAGTTVVTSNGQLVYQWNDKSGNSRHATQATSGNRPTWLSPANGQNGLGAIRFSALYHNLINSTLPISQPFTVFCRVRNNSTNSYPAIFDASSSGSGNRAVLFARRIDATNKPSAYAGTVVGFGSAMSVSYTNYNLGTVFNGSNSVASFNGTETTINPGTFGGTTGYMLSNSADSNVVFYGDICELIVYPSALSSSDRSAIVSYLNQKWGTA